jgi:RES domain-containing protein
MRIWRISEHLDLSGRGGMLAEGRWHRRGIPVVYCADHPATTMLERLVHLDPEDAPAAYRLLAIDVADSAPIARVTLDALPDGWRHDLTATRTIGTDRLSRAEHLLILVPSALVPHAWNVLLNPHHEDVQRCTIAGVFDGLFDSRLVR